MNTEFNGEQGMRLILGDCLGILPSLEEASVDAVVTDPPYGQTNEDYDSPIAFDPAVWRECFRLARPNAALLSFAGGPTYHRVASAIEAAGWKVRQMWAWVFSDGMITSAYPREGFDRLAPAMTPIVFATKGKVLLDLAREGEPWEVRFSKDERHTPYSERSGDRIQRRRGAGGHWPRSVVCTDGLDGFQYFKLSHNAVGRNRSGHPNEKPLPLMRWLVAKLPGTDFLDPFAGSGTTLLACAAEGRECVGVERDATYFAIAERRLAEAQADAPLFAGLEGNQTGGVAS